MVTAMREDQISDGFNQRNEIILNLLPNLSFVLLRSPGRVIIPSLESK